MMHLGNRRPSGGGFRLPDGIEEHRGNIFLGPGNSHRPAPS